MCQSCSHTHHSGKLSYDQVGDASKARLLFAAGKLDAETIEELSLRRLTAPLSKRLKAEALRTNRDKLCSDLFALINPWKHALFENHALSPRAFGELRFLGDIERSLRGRYQRQQNQTVVLGPAIEAWYLAEDIRQLKGAVVELAFLAQHSPYIAAKSELSQIADQHS